MLVVPEGMGQPEPPKRFTRWVAILVALAILAGLIAADIFQKRAQEAKDMRDLENGPGPTGVPDVRIPDDETHRKALATDKEKSKWVAAIPQLDVSALSQSQLEVFLSAANTQRCTCGCGYTLAGCRVYDSSCEKSGPRVAALLDSVRAGQIRSAAGLRTAPAHPG